MDAVTEEQWDGVFACRFVPDEATMKEYQLSNQRKFYCKIPRQSYLPLSTEDVILHYFEKPDTVAGLRISYELVISAGSPPVTALAPEYYPLGVLVDMLLGKREDVGLINFQFRVSAERPENTNQLGYCVDEGRRMLLKMLSQQQKASCSGMFGTVGPMMRVEPRYQTQLLEAITQNEAKSFYNARAVVFELGAQDVSRNPLLPPDLIVLRFHKDGHHATRVVSAKQCPTLGHILRKCVACFATMGDDEIDNSPADSTRYATVLVTGVEPSLCTPSEFLRDALGCADFSVHLTVVQPHSSALPRHILDQERFGQTTPASTTAVAINQTTSSPLT